MELNTTNGAGGTQTTTQTPQSATSGGFGAGTQSSGVQPGTATDLLNQGSSTGVTLEPTTLPSVNLSQVSGEVRSAPAPEQNHFNPALFGISGVFLVIAIALFWSTTRGDKNTTE